MPATRRAILAPLLGLSLMAGVLPGGAAAAILAPHRAVYDLELGDASERSGIREMYGRMVYEFLGNECEGYRVNFRFVTRVDTGGETRLTDQQTTTFEDLKNNSFEFETKSFNDKTLDKNVTGNASRTNGEVSVALTTPSAKSLRLPDSRFPTEHMIAVIEKAEKGEKFFESRIYDGSDSADKTLYTTTVVGKRALPANDDPDAAKAGTLAKQEVWPVKIAYFNDADGKDSLPIYQISFKLYDNGVTRDLIMDYGDFVLKGHLAELKFLDNGACTAK